MAGDAESVGSGAIPIRDFDDWWESGGGDDRTTTPAVWQEVRLTVGSARFPVGRGHVVGDRYVPSPIEATFPGVDGTPAAHIRVEVRSGVPRCTELRFSAHEDGREIRPRDLAAVDLEQWVEGIVAACAWMVVDRDESGMGLAWESDNRSLDETARIIQRSRKNSRRPMTRQRLERVAEAYNSSDTRGLEAVEAAFACSRSTAARYVRQARAEGLIEDRRRNKGKAEG